MHAGGIIGPMLAGAALVLLLAAPEDGVEKLRVAWASQYEWRESGVENATLEFTYRYHWKGGGDWERKYEGRGQVVVGEHGIVRRHFPGAGRDRREEIGGHVEWATRRFARPLFDDEFKDREFGAAVALEDGSLRIEMKPAAENEPPVHLVVKDDRLVARGERLYRLADVAGGYMIVNETSRSARGTRRSRTLETGTHEDRPYPREYRYRVAWDDNTVEIDISFAAPVFNREHPVLGDPAARDLLRVAWARRHVLPEDIRIEAEFRRKIDTRLSKMGWWDTVKGAVQVWGMEKVSVVLDERLHGEDRRMQQRSEEDFRRLLRWMRDRPFDVEFAGCGFELSGDRVLVFGYTPALGFRLEDAKLAGFRDPGGLDWDFRLKKSGDRYRIQTVSGKVDKETLVARIRYARRKGHDVPSYFELIGWDRDNPGDPRRGVVEYHLKKLKVSFP